MFKRNLILFLAIICITCLLFACDIIFGSVDITIKEIIDILFSGSYRNSITRTIIIEFRLYKAITAVLVGAALSVSGLQMQTVFRNPLAGPYVLGISSGASLGVALVVLGIAPFMTYSVIQNAGNWTIAIAAIVGACIILFLILLVSLRVKDIMTILILGILFASATSAIVSIMQYFSKESLLKAYVIWTMGSLADVTRYQLGLLVIFVLAGILLAYYSSKTLNAFLLGENYAKSLGINIVYSRIIIFISTGILAGTVTAFCGPIGFIGIVVPHITKMIFKSSNHFVLIPASMLVGSIAMLASDIISQLPGSATNLPINSVTAVIGIPVVIWIILKNKRIASI